MRSSEFQVASGEFREVLGAWSEAVAGRLLFRANGDKWARHGGHALPGFGIFDL